jgi:predicted O-methyltransferase YrrM
LSSKVKIIVGPAPETLAKLHPPHLFDLAFLDADKEQNVTYFREAKRLVRKGGVIVRISVSSPSCWKFLSTGLSLFFGDAKRS